MVGEGSGQEGGEDMASFNLCTFIGRVGTEPEQRESQDGVQISRFRLAIDAPGREKETQWLTIVSFKKLAGVVGSYVKKGALVLVSGRLSISIYTNAQQQEKTTVEVLANDVLFLTPRRKEEQHTLEEVA
jgi:single-strand DNA-binding protein